MHQFNKTIICLVIFIFLPTITLAIGLSPLHLDFEIERGKETELLQNIQVLNPEEKPLHVTATATGSIAQFVTIDPEDFDLPPGPGPLSTKGRPYQFVAVKFIIPRELPESNYKGEILFTEQPTTGGVLGTAVQLGVTVNLRIGTVAPAEFPEYVTIMVSLLFLCIILSFLYAKKTRIQKIFLKMWVYAIICLVLVIIYKYYTNIFDQKISGYNLSLWTALVVNIILIILSLLTFKESKIITVLGIILAPISTYLYYMSWTNYIYEYLVGFMAIPILLLVISLKSKPTK